MPNGYPINWALPMGSKLETHELYIKYSSQTFDAIAGLAGPIKIDLKNVMATKDSAEIVAYLSWLLRVAALVA